jgi:hypothetical protein
VSLGQKPDFSAAEMRRRRVALAHEMERLGTPYALVYGANRSGSAAYTAQGGWHHIHHLGITVVTRDGRAGVQTGELLLVTGQGPQRLHAYPPGLQQVG